MKRWTFRIVLCLLLGVAPGALTTVAVAWGLAGIVDTRLPTRMLNNPADRPNPIDQKWDVYVLSETGASTIVADRTWGSADGPPHDVYWSDSSGNDRWIDEIELDNGRPIPTWSRASALPDAMNGELAYLIEDARGWPVISMFWSATRGSSKARLSTEGALMVPILDDLFGETTPLPVRPIFPGFLIDTLFYAVIWLALIFGGRAHMRMIRRWQGHCPMCKYDLRGDLDTGCPECGWNRDPRKL